MRARRVLAVACCLTALFVSTSSTRADEANAECANNNDITIVIDFQDLGGGVNVRCSPQPVRNGFDAFTRSNIAVDNYRGFVCRIAGLPTEGPCDRFPPGNYYWVYWLAPRGGDWCYSQVGAGSRTPPPGSVEGWSFFKKTSERPHSTPPRYPVPRVIAGTTPNQLSGGDCATSTSTTTTAAPAPEPTAVTEPNAVTDTTTRGRTTTTTAVGTTASAEPRATTTTALELGLPSTAESITTSSVPFGNVDLTIRRHASKGSPLGFVIGAGAIGALGLASYVLRRRR